MVKNKKAISQVITTVLLVLLAFAAVAILWFVARPFITSSLSGTSALCIEFEPEILSAKLSNGDLNVSVIGNMDFNEGTYRLYSQNELLDTKSGNTAGVVVTLTQTESSVDVGDEVTVIPYLNNKECGSRARATAV